MHLRRNRNCRTLCVHALLLGLAVSVPAQELRERQTRLLLPAAAAPDRPTLVWHTGHFAPVLSVAYSPDGKRLASGGMDQMIFLYDTASDVVEDALRGHEAPVVSLDFSPDSSKLAAGLGSGTVVVWDLATKQIAATLREHDAPVCVSFSPDGKYLAASGLSEGGHGTVTLLTVSDWQVAKTLQCPLPYPTSVVFSPDSKALAALSGDGNGAWSVRVWNVVDQTVSRDWSGVAPRSRIGRSLYQRDFTMPSRAIAFGDSGQRLVGAVTVNSVAVWDLLSGEQLQAAPTGLGTIALAVLRGGDGPARVPLRRPSSPGMGNVSQPQDAASIIRAPEMPGIAVVEAAAGLSGCAAMAPDARRLAVTNGRAVEVWNLTDGSLARSWRHYADPVTGVCISPTADRLAVTREGLPARVHEFATGNIVTGLANPDDAARLLPRESPVSFSADGRVAACVTWKPALTWDAGRLQAASVLRMDLTTGVASSLLAGLSALTRAAPAGIDTLTDQTAFAPVAVRPGGGQVAFAGFHHSGVSSASIDIWDSETGRTFELSTPLTLTGIVPDAAMPAVALAFSQDGNALAAAIAQPEQLEIRPTRAPTRAMGFRTGRIRSFPGFSSQRVRIASKVWLMSWDLVNGGTPGVKALEAPINAPTVRMAFSPDLQSLAVSEENGDAVVFDVASLREKLRVPAQGNACTALSFSPDGSKLACGTVWGQVYIWNMGQAKLEATLLGHMSTVTSLSFSADGQTLASGGMDGAAIMWDLGDWMLPSPRRSLSDLARIGAGMLCRDLPELVETIVPSPIIPRIRAIMVGFDGGSADVVATPEGYYTSTPGASKYARWQLGKRAYPLDEWADDFRRPDLVTMALQRRDVPVVPPPRSAPEVSDTDPVVAFTSPADGTRTPQNREVKITLKVTAPAGIDRIAVTHNGTAVDRKLAATVSVEGKDSLLIRPAAPSREFEAEVVLSASGRASAGQEGLAVKAVAYDTEGRKSSVASLFLPVAEAIREVGDVYVLAVGLSRYTHKAWNTIEYADDDAQAFSRAFVGINRTAKVRVLTNEDATVQGVKFGLRWLKDVAGEDDVAAVFFAGHGVQRGEHYHFLCHDTDPLDFTNTSIPDDDFVKLLAEVNAKRLLLFVDTCHSGGAAGSNSPDELASKANRTTGAAVFAASQGDEVSLERDDWGHGAFTKALLEGFSGAADTSPTDGSVSIREVADYTTARVSELSEGKQHPNLLQLDRGETDMLVKTLPPGVRHTSDVQNLAFSADGSRLASFGGDSKAIVWRVDQRTAEAAFLYPGNPSGYRDTPDLALTPDGKRLIVGNRIWDIDSGDESGILADQNLLARLSPRGDVAITRTAELDAQIVDTLTGESTALPPMPWRDGVFSPNSKLIVGRGGRADLLAWEPEATQWYGDGHQLAALLENAGVLYHLPPQADRRTVMSTSPFDNLPRGLNADTAQQFLRMGGYNYAKAQEESRKRVAEQMIRYQKSAARIDCRAFSPDSQWLLIGADKKIAVLDAPSVLQDAGRRSAALGQRIGTALLGRTPRPAVAVIPGPGGDVTALAMSPAADMVACGDDNSDIGVCRFPSLQFVARFPWPGSKPAKATDPLDARRRAMSKSPILRVEDLHFTADGRFVIARSYGGKVAVWEVTPVASEGAPIMQADDTLCLSLSPDGSLLALGGEDGRIALLDTKTWQEVGSLGQSVLASRVPK